MQFEMLFSLLLVGLEKHTKAESIYPFPSELQSAMNGLALMMGNTYPKTRRDFMALMTEPLIHWWTPHGGPDIQGFDGRFSLLYGEDLSDPAEEFLIAGNIIGVNLSEILTLQDNALMRHFFEQKRAEYQAAIDDEEASQVETDYATVRTFVTENAFTYPHVIRRNMPYHLSEIVLQMYIPAAQQSSRLLFEDKHWHCHECGMLNVDHEMRRQGIKSDVCAVRCPGNAGWEALPYDPNRLILRAGIQRRTLIPGRIEMDLYHWLVEQSLLPNSPLVTVTLYPGVDQYDLRLYFSDHDAWAVDVKDYRLPTELGARIAGHPLQDYSDRRLEWKRAYYVVSDDRNHGSYCQVASQEAGLMDSPTIKLMSMSEFRREVMIKIWELEE